MHALFALYALIFICIRMVLACWAEWAKTRGERYKKSDQETYLGLGMIQLALSLLTWVPGALAMYFVLKALGKL